MSEIVVATPLFDPTGVAYSYFERTATSVLQQKDIDLTWEISIQNVHPRYEELLMQLAKDERVEIVYRVGITSLPEHLTELLLEYREGKVHLLCQDDYYFDNSSLFQISEFLNTWDALFILPESGKLRFKSKVQFESNLSRFKENLGLNTLGGLSTLAWKASCYGESDKDLTYHLYADLEVRDRLRDNGNRKVGIVSGGKLLRESQWGGQAQFSMSALATLEAPKWIAEHPIKKQQIFLAFYLVNLHRNRQIRRALLGTYVEGQSSNVIVQIISTLGFISGIAHGSFVRCRRFFKGHK